MGYRCAGLVQEGSWAAITTKYNASRIRGSQRHFQGMRVYSCNGKCSHPLGHAPCHEECASRHKAAGSDDCTSRNQTDLIFAHCGSEARLEAMLNIASERGLHAAVRAGSQPALHARDAPPARISPSAALLAAVTQGLPSKATPATPIPQAR